MMKRPDARVVFYLVLTGRLHFLAGGVVVAALGTTVAWFEGRSVNIEAFVLGLGVLLSIQLMTHYLNEYWDREGDALVTRRTVFSGGSGVLPAGLIDSSLAYQAALVCAAVAVLLTLVLTASGHMTWQALLVIALGLGGGIAYSQPPLRLVTRGVGEISAACIVSFLGPALAYLLQTGSISPLLILTCLPAAIMMFTMLMAVELPDYAADIAAAKRNLVVRLGIVRAARLNNAALLAVYLVSGAAVLARVPVLVAALPLLQVPVALVHMRLVQEIAHGDERRAPWLTFVAVALFFTFCGLQVAGYASQR